MATALTSLPQNLEETYQRMFERIPTRLKSDAIRLLQFLVHSERPLKLVEAKEVITTQIENGSQGFDIKRRLICETYVLDYCPGLATVVHVTEKELHLAHFSVKEYLLELDQFNILTASISITRTLLTYLTDISGGSERIGQDFPMAGLAARVWAGFAAKAQASEDIVRATVRFIEDDVTFQRWIRLYQADKSWQDDPGPPRGSKLYYTCLVGLAAAARDLIAKRADINAQGGRYGNALCAASLDGHREIVTLLLEKGADVNAQSGSYGNALCVASLEGHQEIATLLLEKGADINSQGGIYGNALQAASSRGYREIVTLLLEKGADINAQCGMYGNALCAAAVEGHQEIVTLLLENGADINA